MLGRPQANLFVQHYEIGLQILMKPREMFERHRVLIEVLAQILHCKGQTNPNKNHDQLK